MRHLHLKILKKTENSLFSLTSVSPFERIILNFEFFFVLNQNLSSSSFFTVSLQWITSKAFGSQENQVRKRQEKEKKKKTDLGSRENVGKALHAKINPKESLFSFDSLSLLRTSLCLCSVSNKEMSFSPLRFYYIYRIFIYKVKEIKKT